ncbi:hypothetical protein DEJ23_06335 [Curtobacterium sp. MCSS17_008]|uniref:glycosyltransferase family 2 protein n=1 Tax=Curtobacterium sp. MCSS17_008 TaxID=2175647 RepID=UPI000DA86FED|nr:glycosyltransferase family 2 protein [Curtobacterium sp. MCSS17_008]PZF57755.1 hypothetical protein DEJ23_06335 [Curtobacterium sp. MCSS17_008]
MAADLLISVVVPSTLRPSLGRTLQSVAAQDWSGRLEVILVIDLDAETHPVGVPNDFPFAMTILFTGGRRGGASARNMGVDAAEGDYIAFLDDDDLWEPNKLSSQMSLLRAELHEDRDRPVIVSSQIRHQRDDLLDDSVIPKRLIEPDERVEEYLFRGRTPSNRRQSLYTSTLLVSAELARSVRWDETLTRHQDWDWLISAQRLGGARIFQVREPLVRIVVGSTGSISGGSDWESSLAWLQRQREWSRQAQADFLAAQTLRYALQARSWPGVFSTIRALSMSKRLPSAGPALIALAGALPRHTLNKVLVRNRRATSVR